MGNKANNKPNTVIKGNNLDERELEEVKDFKKTMLVDGVFSNEIFNSVVFHGLPVKISEWQNDVYKRKKLDRVVKDLSDCDDLNFFIYMLTNYNYNDNDDFYIYQRKNIVVILYDLLIGKVTDYQDMSLNQDETPINITIFFQILSFAFKIFKSVQKLKFDSKETEMQEMLKLTLEKFSFKEIEKVNMKDLMSFCQAKLGNLDAYFRMYFSKIFLNTKNSFMTVFPILTEVPDFLSIENYFCFCLSNSHIMNK